MNYLFPYKFIPAGSRVALYGGGAVGKDFFFQIRYSEYCELVVWVDRLYCGFDLNPPFDMVENLNKYDFDKIILAVINNKVAEEMKNNLERLGVDSKKVVYVPAYYLLGSEQFPTNKDKYLLNIEFYMQILEDYLDVDTVYGGVNYYQSYIEMGIRGLRHCGERIALYHIKDYLKPTDEVLDIGCNCGFLDMQIAPYVRRITGIEIEPKFVGIANKIKDEEGISNVDFLCEDYWGNTKLGVYDAVFAFAIHTNIMMSGANKESFCNDIIDHLKPGGYLFFESHNIQNDLERYIEFCNEFKSKGMEECYRQNYMMEFDRIITIFRRQV